MKITVLGTSAAYPEAGRACSGILIEEDNNILCIDIGGGTLSNLQKHFSISDITALFISHMHPDHFLDIYPLRYFLEYDAKLNRKFKVFGPAGFADVIISLQPESSEAFRKLLEFREIEEGSNCLLNGFQISAIRTKHPIETYALKVCSKKTGKTVVYTADTGLFDELISFSNGCGLLICECTYSEEGPKTDSHMRSDEIGKLAEKANVKKVLLTHFWPGVNRKKARSEVMKEYNGQVLIANENEEFWL